MKKLTESNRLLSLAARRAQEARLLAAEGLRTPEGPDRILAEVFSEEAWVESLVAMLSGLLAPE